MCSPRSVTACGGKKLEMTPRLPRRGAKPRTARGRGRRREEAGDDALADPQGVEAQDDHRDDPEDEDGADDDCEERWGRAAGPGGTRHAAPRCGWDANASGPAP